jgi:hypothetical protein
MAKASIKKWYQSKIIWAGFLLIIASITDAVSAGFGWRHTVVAVLGAVIAYLRSITVDMIDFGD